MHLKINALLIFSHYSRKFIMKFFDKSIYWIGIKNFEVFL